VSFHRGHQEFEVFLGIAEGLLAIEQGSVDGGRRGGHGRQVLQPDLGLGQPLAVGPKLGELVLEFRVVDDASGLHVDQEHPAGLQPPLLDDLVLRNVEHTHLRRHNHQVIVGNQVARRAQAIAVERGADLAAIGKGHGRRSVPRLHQRSVVFVETLALLVHQLVVMPRFRDEQHHGMGQRIAAGHQQLECVVEASRVRLTLGDQRPQLVEIRAQQGRCH